LGIRGIIREFWGLFLAIIGENRYFSFADAGLIEEYNSDFLSLKEGKRA
jgi:hypothetical protein